MSEENDQKYYEVYYELPSDTRMMDHDYNDYLLIVDERNTELPATIENEDSQIVEMETEVEAEVLPIILPRRKRKVQPETWKKNRRKTLRNLGLEYVNTKNIVVPARKMKPRGCSCNFGCKKINTAERQSVFTKFWALGDQSKQWAFIAQCMVPLKITRRARGNVAQLRSPKNAYYFDIDGRKVRVCKQFFMSTLNIGNKFICNVETKLKTGDQRGKHSNHKAKPHQSSLNQSHSTTATDTDTEMDNSSVSGMNDTEPEENCTLSCIKAHITSIPRIEQHYLRKIKSISDDQQFISGEKTLSELFKDYTEKYRDTCKELARYPVYRNTFKSLNVNFFVEEDYTKCASCDIFQKGGEESISHKAHLQDILREREEQKEDCELAKSGVCVTAFFDLQALPTPCANDVSQFYYHSRLTTSHFTMFDVEKDLVQCSIWHEGSANHGPNEIGTCLYKFLKKNRSDKPIVIYAEDSIQNKNKYILALIVFMVKKYCKIPSVTLKYLTIGHVDTEIVDLHSRIEKQKKIILKSGPIYHPGQWKIVIQSSLTNDYTYEVDELHNNDMIDIKKLCLQIGDNYNMTDDGELISWNDIKIIKVEEQQKGFSFQVKTSFDNDETGFHNISIRTSDFIPILLKAYPNEPKISLAKKDDLISLCKSNNIKTLYHQFYENLPAGCGKRILEYNYISDGDKENKTTVKE